MSDPPHELLATGDFGLVVCSNTDHEQQNSDCDSDGSKNTHKSRKNKLFLDFSPKFEVEDNCTSACWLVKESGNLIAAASDNSLNEDDNFDESGNRIGNNNQDQDSATLVVFETDSQKLLAETDVPFSFSQLCAAYEPNKFLTASVGAGLHLWSVESDNSNNFAQSEEDEHEGNTTSSSSHFLNMEAHVYDSPVTHVAFSQYAKGVIAAGYQDELFLK